MLINGNQNGAAVEYSPTALSESNRVKVQDDDNRSVLDRIMEEQAQVAARYQPVMEIDQSIARFKAMQRYIAEVLEEGVDYGAVPGVDKPFLWKSGAQKLCLLFGYVPHYTPEMEIEDWSGERFG